ncbi:MAG: NADP-dependent malic enzyme [Rickettsiales bacterium]|nr:NADP-dependent malic enzyme [Rickettsiales bacterium]
MSKEKEPITDQEALAYHAEGKPGKISILPTKPLMTQRDLSLGYSPGVAVPCLAIQKDPATAYDYTARGNFVAVISNGTAVLGLGNLGALASKPVMEGKAILFKRFADVDAVDIEVDTTNVDEFVNCVRLLGPSWGGINLEDIAAPDCFVIEQRLREAMDIPVFHDDQHGTAIIVAAGLINACHLTGRKMKDVKVVVLGAGSAGIACLELIKRMGVKHENALLVDKTGVIYEGRTEGMNQWKSAHAVKTDKRTLADAMKGADMFMGLAGKDAVSKEMVATMAKNPIIFAMANPDPEIRPEDVRSVRKDAIIATGRSDYPNQVNNVMGFPYIFRGALDVRASQINEEMKVAAAEAIAALAREDVPEEVAAAYSGRQMTYGPDYIIPAPFDPRLMTTVPVAVAKAAMETGVARKPILDIAGYKKELAARRDPTANSMQHIFDKVRDNPQRVIFAEGEEEKIIRAAVQWRDNGYGAPILVGRVDRIQDLMKKMHIADYENIEISNAAINPHVDSYIDYLYPRLQRQGFLYRDVARMVKNDRNIYASCMLAMGHGDAMITGVTRNYTVSLENVTRVIDTREGDFLFGITLVVAKGKTLFFADTAVNELPEPDMLATIAVKTAHAARRMGHEPRVALLSYSTFGNPMREKSIRIRDTVKVLDSMNVDFEYDGEMAANVAVNKEMLSLYPFCRLSGPANVLVMPALHSAHIASHLLQELSDGITIGPVTMGLKHPVQIVQMDATVSEILNMTALAAMEAIAQEEKKVTSLVKGKKKKA